MDRIKYTISGITRFLSISLFIDLGMFLLVSALCLFTDNCSGAQWSEYMFWLSMLVLIAGMPAVLASLSASRGYFDNPLTAGQDMLVAQTIIQSERRQLSKRTLYTLRMFSIGIIGIAISAFIDILTRTNP
jgi:hypothetical protein